MAVEQQVGYKDVNPFFQHINWLLEEEARTRWKYNDISPAKQMDARTQQLIHLEDWYMTLETLYDRIIGKLEDEEIKEIDNIKKEIEDKTQGDNFTTASLSNSDMIAVRTTCRKLSRRLNQLLWKHKIHVDVKPTKINGMVW